MKRFGTQGPVHPSENYFVRRAEKINDFISRIKEGRYIVIFAPRQTGKTTFFQQAFDKLITEAPTYFPIPLNFDVYKNLSSSTFYEHLYQQIRQGIEQVYQKCEAIPSEALTQFLVNTTLTDHLSMLEFFRQFASFLGAEYSEQKVVIVIDEFDGIPQAALSDFLHTLRHIYIAGKPRCPHSVSIIGVKSITQLNYDRSISPFNIQDEFDLPNFTLEEVRELLGQYTAEVKQAFAPEVITSIYKQTAGQPVLVNRLAQILTEEMDILKTETITMLHFTKAHTQLLRYRNTNIEHLTTNIRKDPRFEKILMRITAHDDGVNFNLDDEIISELATYGVITEGTDGSCNIANPIYLYRILRAFKPTVNGLEEVYFPEDNINGFRAYLTDTGQIDMQPLLDNFRDFIARAGFRILQVPQTPQESVGRHLLLTYLDQFVQIVDGSMFLEVQTGRGRIDLCIIHNQQKYIVETKIWRGESRYQAGKRQLAVYLKLEKAIEGYYVVFDHRKTSEQRVETEVVEGITIRSYVIPVVQQSPSSPQD